MIEPQERETELEAMANRLRRDRPVPRAGFRAELRARLLAAPAGGGAPRRRVRILIAACGGAGAALLLIGALGVAGSGPLAA